MEVAVSTDAMGALERELKTLADVLDTARTSTASQLEDLGADWTDAGYSRSAARIAGLLDRLDALMKQIWTMSQYLSVLGSRVESVAGVLAAHAAAVAAQPAAPPAVPRSSADSPWERLQALSPIDYGGRSMRLLDPADFQTSDFDWGTAQPEVEFSQTHHGTAPDRYESLVKAVGQELGGNTRNNAPSARVRAAFVDNPVRLDRRPDGKIDIIEGRHRLWAAKRLGISIPVTITDGRGAPVRNGRA